MGPWDAESLRRCVVVACKGRGGRSGGGSFDERFDDDGGR